MPTPIDAADELRRALRPLTFPAPVSHTYNPLDYAWERHCDYLERFGKGPKRVLMLGMNPAPTEWPRPAFPLAKIPVVRDWAEIRRLSHCPDNRIC